VLVAKASHITSTFRSTVPLAHRSGLAARSG